MTAVETDAAPDPIDTRSLLDLLLGRPDWHYQAACRGKGPDAWFPTRPGTTAPSAAQRVCQSCPVRVQCLAFALSAPPSQSMGIWGGVSEKRRARARRRGLTAEQLIAELDA